MTAPIGSPTVVEVFADIWCPYAHVGIRRFVHRRWAARRDDLVLHVRAWPLELVNGEPLDARHVAEQVEDLRRQVAPELFGGFDSSRFPRTTLPALDLVNDAYASGVGVGERASLAVRDALFERSDDISDPAVLDRLRVDLALSPPRPDARNLSSPTGPRVDVAVSWALHTSSSATPTSSAPRCRSTDTTGIDTSGSTPGASTSSSLAAPPRSPPVPSEARPLRSAEVGAHR